MQLSDTTEMLPTDELDNTIIIHPYQNNIKHNWLTNTYLHLATSDNTRKAYRSDIRHYESWGGKLPATPQMIAEYLYEFAEKLNPRTLTRRLIAIKHWHTYQDYVDPTAHPIITKTIIGIQRSLGKPKDKAHALTTEELTKIAISLANDSSLNASRDNALLQIGFFGALRRSELVAIHYEHIRWDQDGIEILLPTSKTDQANEGQFCVIPYGNETLCPIRTLKHWLTLSGINSGPIFRRINQANQLGNYALGSLSVNHILKQRAKTAGLPNPDDLSSHSLRRGLATSAARAGAPLQAIMRAGRWKQTNTVMEYIEASERFNDNAATSVLLAISDQHSKS